MLRPPGPRRATGETDLRALRTLMSSIRGRGLGGFLRSILRVLIPASTAARTVLAAFGVVAFAVGFRAASAEPRGPDAVGDLRGLGIVVFVFFPGLAILALALVQLVWRRRLSLVLVFGALIAGAAIGSQFGPWYEVHTITGGRLTLHLATADTPELSGPAVCMTSKFSADIQRVEAVDIGTLDDQVVSAVLYVGYLSSLDLDRLGTAANAELEEAGRSAFFDLEFTPGSTGVRGEARLTAETVPDTLLIGNGLGSFTVAPPLFPVGSTLTWDCPPLSTHSGPDDNCPAWASPCQGLDFAGV
jgi:hypothetical protein